MPLFWWWHWFSLCVFVCMANNNRFISLEQATTIDREKKGWDIYLWTMFNTYFTLALLRRDIEYTEGSKPWRKRHLPTWVFTWSNPRSSRDLFALSHRMRNRPRAKRLITPVSTWKCTLLDLLRKKRARLINLRPLLTVSPTVIQLSKSGWSIMNEHGRRFTQNTVFKIFGNIFLIIWVKYNSLNRESGC